MKIRHYFTIFELLIAVGLLVMLTVVLLRMFLLTSDLWSASDEQARLYADAQTALSLISDDLNNIVYQNTSANTPAGATDVTAPLWLERNRWLNLSSVSTINAYALSEYQTYTAGLHFVTRPSMKPQTQNASGLYMVSYRFLPPLASATVPNSWPAYVSYSEGVLVRACVGNENFLNRQATTPMSSVFAPTDSDFKVVITGVLEFNVMAYQTISNWDQALTPATLEEGTSIGANNITTIQIELKLIPPERIPGLRQLSQTEDIEEYLSKYSRTFSKTIRIRNRVGEE